MPVLFNDDRVEIADIHAHSAFAAQTFINPVRLLLFTKYRFFGARAAAYSAPMTLLRADVRINPVRIEFAADMGRAFVGLNVGKVFIAELSQRPENRVRRCLAQAAQGGVSNNNGQFFQQAQLLQRSAAF